MNLLGSLIRPHDGLKGNFHDPFTLLTTCTERGIARLAAACVGYTSGPDWYEHMYYGLNELAQSSVVPLHLRRHAKTLRDALETAWDTAPLFFKRNGRIIPDAPFPPPFTGEVDGASEARARRRGEPLAPCPLRFTRYARSAPPP